MSPLRVVAIGVALLGIVGCPDDDDGGMQPAGTTENDTTPGAASSGGVPVGSSGAVTDGSGAPDPTMPADTTAGADESSSSTGSPIVLPMPCAEVASVAVSEPPTEPNDTPEQATDLCTIDVVGSWHVAAEIGGDDRVDHFVFHAAGDSGVVPLLLDACFDVALELALHQAADDGLVLLWTGMSQSPDCDGIPQAVPAGHDYVLVVAVPEGASVPAGTAYGW